MTPDRPSYIHTPARRFELHRDADETGVSGTGVVASGLCWADGRAAIRWHTPLRSTTAYESMADVEAIHGHGGKTRIVWLDIEGDQAWCCIRCGGGSFQDACFDCGAHGSTALVPLWFADDVQEQFHLRWQGGAKSALYRVEQAVTLEEARASIRAMLEQQRASEARRVQELQRHRAVVRDSDQRTLVWTPVAS